MNAGSIGSLVPASIEHIVHVEVLRGKDATDDTLPDLLVEVPHGADERTHYDVWRARLTGDLPDDLDAFFHINTDVGAWDYGRRTALLVLEQEPSRAAVVVRSLIPRTFIDCNRPADFSGGDLAGGGLTAGIPSYVRGAADRALLIDAHKRYVAATEAAYALVCGAGGLALLPHTYGPRSLGIDAIGDDIVHKLEWACAPEREHTWPLRAEVDLLTRDGDGIELSPPGAEAALLDAFSAAGIQAKANDTYYLHPSSLGHIWSTAYLGRVVSLEVRRDLLVNEWRPFEEMRAVPEKSEHIAEVLAPVVTKALPAMLTGRLTA